MCVILRQIGFRIQNIFIVSLDLEHYFGLHNKKRVLVDKIVFSYLLFRYSILNHTFFKGKFIIEFRKILDCLKIKINKLRDTLEGINKSFLCSNYWINNFLHQFHIIERRN